MEATTRFTYDRQHRLIAIDHPDGTAEQATYACDGMATYTDRDGVLHRYVYDAQGRLRAKKSGDHEEAYRYDPFNRLLVKGEREGRESWRKTHYVYDEAGRQHIATTP